jgi:hypothetical protein
MPASREQVNKGVAVGKSRATPSHFAPTAGA